MKLIIIKVHNSSRVPIQFDKMWAVTKNGKILFRSASFKNQEQFTESLKTFLGMLDPMYKTINIDEALEYLEPQWKKHLS